MQYLGGKARLGKSIAKIISELRAPGQPYLEPFLGGANVVIHLRPDAGPRYASDLDSELVAMWQAVQAGWSPPTEVSEEFYAEARAANDNQIDPATRAFVKFACSWGGKPWGGYARDPRSPRNFAEIGARSVGKKAAGVHGVQLAACSYDAWNPDGCIVYCDPPYAGTTGYRVDFDHERFWSTVRRWSARNTVLVSEYAAPSDFGTVAEFPFTRGLDDARIVERVFRYAPAVANDNA